MLRNARYTLLRNGWYSLLQNKWYSMLQKTHFSLFLPQAHSLGYPYFLLTRFQQELVFTVLAADAVGFEQFGYGEHGRSFGSEMRAADEIEFESGVQFVKFSVQFLKRRDGPPVFDRSRQQGVAPGVVSVLQQVGKIPAACGHGHFFNRRPVLLKVQAGPLQLLAHDGSEVLKSGFRYVSDEGGRCAEVVVK